MSSVIFGPSVQVESSNPTLPKTADDHPAEPLARYGAMWKARFTSGSAAVELHHPLGRDLAAGVLHGARALVRGGGEPGLYHVAGSQETSWAGFAQGMFERSHARAALG